MFAPGGERSARIMAAGLVAIGMLAQGAHAASSTGSFRVRLIARAKCTVSVTAMNFGTITRVTGSETATSTATVSCNRNTFYALSLGLPAVRTIANAIGSAALTLRNGTNTIAATLTVRNARQQATGGNDITQIGGRLTAQAAPAPGVYQATQAFYVIY